MKYGWKEHKARSMLGKAQSISRRDKRMTKKEGMKRVAEERVDGRGRPRADGKEIMRALESVSQ